MNSSCKPSLFPDAFRQTVVDLFREFYKLTINACIYKPIVSGYTEANDHKGLAEHTNRNRRDLKKN